ncbi:MAG TPA: magnesium-translocating P-type ATPase [Acidimicrobiales bacterium]|nr:magnesium-translocating P-type ATPase [Acidimicrobiales bacterium]
MSLTATSPRAGAELDLNDSGTLSPDEVLGRLGSRREGLSSVEVATRLKTFGPNTLATRRVRVGAVLWRQLRNPILVLLLAAALVSGLTGGGTNAVIIAVIVAASVGLGFFNEYRAERGIDAMKAQIRYETEVRRSGTSYRIPVTELVPGDIVSLRIGDIVPADLRLLADDGLECDEAVLTGESVPVVKSAVAEASRDSDGAGACCFMGTIVHEGSGLGVVVETGIRTKFGQIAAGLGEHPTPTGFEKGLGRFSRFLFAVAGALTIFIFIINLVLHRPFIDALLFSLAIAVGIAPEMMPAIVTVSLASGSRALMARNVLVKRLVAIEDLGNIELLFTDKTGTLTEGVITFEHSLDVHGQPATTPFVLGLVCNEATVTATGPAGGNTLDQALWLSPQAQPGTSAADQAARYTKVKVLPFDHERRLSSAVVRTSDGDERLLTKGAPEAVLERCVDVPDDVAQILETLFAGGARVVAVASRSWHHADAIGPLCERRLTLEGFLTFADRPKLDAGPAISRLASLGVEVKIITGDNGLVAKKVCSEIGLDCARILSGDDVDKLDDESLRLAIPETTVFARISPDQKSRIIQVARRAGEDVAFLGDGVNDAVALHHADVGISVDSGTDVAKDAADVVLLDKDLGVLADGVMEGRRIFANTMKYVLMATSSNFGNMFSAAGASAFLSFLPMLPSQILLNNLLYNAGQLVIPTDRVDQEALARPAAWDMRFIGRFMAVFGPVSSIFDFLTFWVMLSILHAGHVEFRTGWFVESIATQTLVIYVIRTRRVPFFRSRPSVPMLLVPTSAALVGAVLPYTGLAHMLGFSPLPLAFFLLLAGMVVVYLFLVELAKLRFYRHRSAPRTSGRRISPRLERREHQFRRVASRFVRHHRAGGFSTLKEMDSHV